MGVVWQAPRTAYLLTAATADNDAGAAQAIWDALDPDARDGVLAALAAQARLNVQMTLAELGAATAAGAGEEVGLACRETWQAFAALPPPGQIPRDRHWATWLATLSVKMAAARGLPAGVFARLCRNTADSAAAVT